MPGNMILNPDFKEFFQLLNANEVRYLIVGGYAVAYHGYPRYTRDIDIWVWIDQDNAQKVVKTLGDFGFASLGLMVKDFLEPDTIIQLGYAPNRIDLIMGLPGVEFEDCYPKRVEEDVDGVRLPFIDLESLKKSKQASGRLQDLADFENLE
jgi:Aminoglycoside-2''-adenylyltransferase